MLNFQRITYIILKYSIIIATYNRRDELEELLASVSELKFDTNSFEILISDDGSTDDTKQFLEESKFSFQLNYISQSNQGPGAARNHGMQKAKGQYFIFVDSDVMLPPDYLQKVDEAIEQNEYDAFGGPDTYHPSFSPLLKAINYSMTSFIGTGGTRGAKKSVSKFYPRSFNMGINRTIYEKIGGMNKLRHGQDMDFSARIYKAGFKVGLIPDAFVYHKRRTSLKRFFKQIFNWGVARINLSRLHEQMLKPVHLIPGLIILLLVITIIVSLIMKVHVLLLLIGGGGALVALFAFFQSLLIYKSLTVALLSIITLFTQVIAYGLGTLNGIWQVFTGSKEAKGFTKNYYS